MPFSASVFSCTKSSVNLEFPPSITRSPSDSTPDSSAITESVILPAGTMTHTMRGPWRTAARSARVATSETSGFVSYPTTSMPAPRRRMRMLLPMRPRPTRPICMWVYLRESAQQQVGLQQVAVVVRRRLVLARLAGDEHGAGLVRVLRLGERDPDELRVHRAEAVEQELGLEGDHGVRPVEQRFDVLGR